MCVCVMFVRFSPQKGFCTVKNCLEVFYLAHLVHYIVTVIKVFSIDANQTILPFIFDLFIWFILMFSANHHFHFLTYV